MTAAAPPSGRAAARRDGDGFHGLVLAGSRAGETDVIARSAGVPCKALAAAAGRPMIERSLGVLLDSPRLGAIEVALPAATDIAAAPDLADWQARGRVRFVEPAASPVRTVAAALARLAPGQPLLVTTADHALLDAAILNQFLDRCPGPDVDAAAGLLPLEILEAAYPGMKRTGLRLRDGTWSGCNLFLLRNTPGARSLLAFWTRLESLRKSPLRMAMTIGPAALLGYGLRLLTLARALAWIGRRAGAGVAPVMLDIPEAAIDVDSLQDLAVVENLLRQRGAALA